MLAGLEVGVRIMYIFFFLIVQLGLAAILFCLHVTNMRHILQNGVY